MTQSSFARVALFAAFLFAVTLARSSAFAIAPLTAPTNSESAEVCTSLDGHYMALRGFGDTTGILVIYDKDPKVKPVEKEGYTFKKDPSGTTQKNEVTFDMFELMAEPFGKATKPESMWKKAYEVLFDGQVTIIDDKQRELGTIPMNCNAAMVDYL